VLNVGKSRGSCADGEGDREEKAVVISRDKSDLVILVVAGVPTTLNKEFGSSSERGEKTQ